MEGPVMWFNRIYVFSMGFGEGFGQIKSHCLSNVAKRRQKPPKRIKFGKLKNYFALPRNRFEYLINCRCVKIHWEDTIVYGSISKVYVTIIDDVHVYVRTHV